MNIKLAKSIYPIEHIQVIAEEFCIEFSLQIIEIKESTFTIELQAKEQNSDLKIIAGRCLNRLLEKTITEKFG